MRLSKKKSLVRLVVVVKYMKEEGYLPSLLIRKIVCLTSLVDPASSHMLVSKTKPCMSKYELC